MIAGVVAVPTLLGVGLSTVLAQTPLICRSVDVTGSFTGQQFSYEAQGYVFSNDYVVTYTCPLGDESHCQPCVRVVYFYKAPGGELEPGDPAGGECVCVSLKGCATPPSTGDTYQTTWTYMYPLQGTQPGWEYRVKMGTYNYEPEMAGEDCVLRMFETSNNQTDVFVGPP